MNDNIKYLVPPGNIRCYVSGRLRKDTPEENVRQRWARSLVEEYGYKKDEISLEFPIYLGSSRKRVDIAVFKPGTKHEQTEILLILETKRDDIKISDAKKGELQLVSYMSACPSCSYGLWVGKERQALEKLTDNSIERIADIPRAGDHTPRIPERKDLRPALDLSSVFRRCHNYIHANGGYQKAEAFHEMLKLIFCKMHDEEMNEPLFFVVDPKEQRTESGWRRVYEERVTPLFKQVKERYPHIFSEDETIKLDPRILAYIVAEMQYISLTMTDTDIKGAAYEELVGENLRGDRGEYFTPRNVCDMCVKLVMSQYRVDDLQQLKVLDCCTGTGGFLVSWIDNLRSIYRDQEKKWYNQIDENRIRGKIRDICSRNQFGLDINPFLVRTAQMNLVMHGDGSTNIFRVDSARSPGEWSEEARRKVPYGKIDVVLTNPPFGSEVKIDDRHILDQYELTTWETESPRSWLPAEQLFVETAMKILREGGFLGIVLPDGILNNPGLKFLRSWLLSRGRIIATIDLPKETFSRNGGVNNPSVLLVQKYTAQEMRDVSLGIIEKRHRVFMAAPKSAGVDKRGKPIYLRYADGREIVDENGERLVDDEISVIPELYDEWKIRKS
ncbi:MAG: N-6 DNA methylase [Eubacteriales bacterium]|nr:N-6 DNA methylase [Christensenellaceae bacterium]MEA5067179.1 N-6 DNA methylase [Eubacteriales bacterium]